MDVLRIVFGSLSAGLQFAGLVFISRNFMKKKYVPSLYMAIAWSGFMFEAFFYVLKYSFETGSWPHQFFNMLENLSLIPGFLGMLALIDTVSKDSIDPRKFSVALFMLGIDAILFIMYYESDLVILPIIIMANVGLVVGLSWFYFCIVIFRNVPASLKRPAAFNIIGALLVSVMYVIANRYISGLSKYIPSIDRIFQAVGAFIHAVVFAKYDQLYYVLPFKAQRLVTFGTSNGISLFTHTWNRPDQAIDEDLFSSMLHGVSMLVNESLKKGNVQEIKLEKGVLLIDRDAEKPIASVLVASRSSRVLREGLFAFNRQFVEKYAGYLDQHQASEVYGGAKELVDSCFAFIPVFE